MDINEIELHGINVQQEVRKMIDVHISSGINGIVAEIERNAGEGLFKAIDYQDAVESYFEIESFDEVVDTISNLYAGEVNISKHVIHGAYLDTPVNRERLESIIIELSEDIGYEGIFNAAELAGTRHEWENEREAVDYYIVSDWMLGKLQNKDQITDGDFFGLNVWARECSGQHMSMDGVMKDIWAESMFPTSELKDKIDAQNTTEIDL